MVNKIIFCRLNYSYFTSLFDYATYLQQPIILLIFLTFTSSSLIFFFSYSNFFTLYLLHARMYYHTHTSARLLLSNTHTHTHKLMEFYQLFLSPQGSRAASHLYQRTCQKKSNPLYNHWTVCTNTCSNDLTLFITLNNRKHVDEKILAFCRLI